MKYDLVIFDLDGTILNTLEDLADSTNYALQTHHMPVRTIDEVRNFVGNGIGKLIERAVPAGTDTQVQMQILEAFKQYYKQHCADKTMPYAGTEEMILTLRQNGVRTAVVSNKADFAVQSLCEDYFPKLFDYVVGEREGIRRKPYPDSVLEVLKQLQIDLKRAVYVGDSEVDIQTAVNAGMDVISVNWGFRKEEFLRENGAQKIVDSWEELLAAVL